MNNTPQEIHNAIKQAKSIITCMDARFDFDALCAPLALKHILTKATFHEQTSNKQYTITFDGTIPGVAKQLLNIDCIKENTPPETIDFTQYDCMIFLDSGSQVHIANSGTFVAPPHLVTINIDHHDSNPHYGKLNYVNNNAVSTCSVLAYLFKEWGIDIDTTVAKSLIPGILTDSGFFQYHKTTSKDLEIVADAMNKGVNLFDICWKLTFTETLKIMQMKGIIYSNLKINYDKRFAYSYYLLEDLKRLGITEADLQTLVPADLIKTLTGVDFIFIVKEREKGKQYNISFRSHEPNFDVARLAIALGGGGHRVAASCSQKLGSVEEAVAKVESLISKPI